MEQSDALLKSWTTSAIPSDLRKANTLLCPGTAGSMTFCTYSPANFAHDARAWPGFIVGAGLTECGRDASVPCFSKVRSRVLVSPATVPSRPRF